ncbi:MAG: nucleoside hydrolase [Bacteroidales bacterium]|nr:nucleoside hydrolase [Bacteroidales bacterium]
MIRKILFIVFGLAINLCLYSHPWKPSHYVIIDTDGGTDDIKTITMLLASPDVRVLAITVSPGVLSAENAYVKVKSLLNSFYHEGLPVGINRTSRYKSEDFPVALEKIWGSEEGISPADAPEAIALMNNIFSAEKTKISFINLGSLSTAWTALNGLASFSEQVNEFIWSADGADDTRGFNYNIDKNASVMMLKQEIPVKIVRSFDLGNESFYDNELIGSISTINTPYAKKISEFLRSDLAKSHKFSYSGTDEMVAVFLHHPELFNTEVSGNISDCVPADVKAIKDAVIRILEGETIEEHQVIRDLPFDPAFYSDDISPYVTDIIEKHGHNEWDIGVFASEMHRHLGVFEIVGVKMGIRALEYFCTGVDEFELLAFAGSTPPLSCMIDGLLVSTGATPGHGLLTVSDDPVKKPAAEFSYMNRKIRMSLKPELADKISAELKEINFIYGLDSDIYWELVREKTIRYWRDLDRHEIFLIEEIE